MNSTRHDDKADKIPQSGGADKPTHDAKDLTCNEAQVEELLSEGESTETRPRSSPDRPLLSCPRDQSPDASATASRQRPPTPPSPRSSSSSSEATTSSSSAGNFWDGRATGEELGSPAADQAQGPFLNPAEQGLADAAWVVWRVCKPVVPADYPAKMEEVWGKDACAIAWPADVAKSCAAEGGQVALSAADRAKADKAYDKIAKSIAAYEGSAESSPFASKLDDVLAKRAQLTDEESKGSPCSGARGSAEIAQFLGANIHYE